MELSFKLKKSPSFVLNYLTDMQKFASAHPVIYKVEKTGTNTYLVSETLRFGPIPISFTYPISIEFLSKEQCVIYNAVVMKFTRIEMRFFIKSEAEHTSVFERITFKSLLPIQGIMRNVFTKQHKQLFINIENLNE